MKNRSFNSTNNITTTDFYFSFPFQTKSIKDFYNLLDVYAHMIYDPLIS